MCSTHGFFCMGIPLTANFDCSATGIGEVIGTAHRCRHALELFSREGIRVVRLQRIHQANAMRSRAHHSAKATKRDAYIGESELYVRYRRRLLKSQNRELGRRPEQGSRALRPEDPS